MTKKKATKSSVTYACDGIYVEDGLSSLEELRSDVDWLELGEEYVVYEIKPIGTMTRKTVNEFTPN